MNFGIHIGAMGGPLAEMRKLWKFADAKGFDWFSVSDHFQESPPRGGDMDCYEAIAILTAAAMDTAKIRLGSGVAAWAEVVPTAIRPADAASVAQVATMAWTDLRRRMSSPTDVLTLTVGDSCPVSAEAVAGRPGHGGTGADGGAGARSPCGSGVVGTWAGQAPPAGGHTPTVHPGRMDTAYSWTRPPVCQES